MIRLVFLALATATGLAVAGLVWLRGPQLPIAEVRTVELAPHEPAGEPAPGPVVEEAVAEEAIVEESSAEAAVVEEALEDPAPFLEAELAESETPLPVGEREAGAALDSLERGSQLAAVDQDAWAARIRRMLAVYGRVGVRR